ncbi:MAG: YggW family oxidoreductase [Legionellales bacterium]|nr:YggW family oxidoreductase [Legionellales bacterium]
MNKPPLSLYCHVPWCIEKCPYCDFNSFKKNSSDDFEQYTSALRQDIIDSAKHAENRQLISIFIGGGTPSLFPTKEVHRILDTIYSTYDCAPDCEITLEMNPSSFESAKMKDWKQSGVNRVSIGVQSFDNTALSRLGRSHSRTDSEKSIQTALDMEFDEVNIDIMYGLPDQSVSEAMADLRHGISFKTTHLSWYELTIEPGTLFSKQPPNRPDEDKLHQMDMRGQELFNKSHLEQYEISAYAAKGSRCKHNMNYWKFGDYIGCGNGASSKITTHHGITRYQRYRNPGLYQTAPTHRCVEHQVEHSQQLFEFMLNHLRLHEPIELASICDRTQLTKEEILNRCHAALEEDMLIITDSMIEKTKRGNRYLNNLQTLFL